MLEVKFVDDDGSPIPSIPKGDYLIVLKSDGNSTTFQSQPWPDEDGVYFLAALVKDGVARAEIMSFDILAELVAEKSRLGQS